MDFKSLLLSFPSGVEKELYITEVGASGKNFESLLDIALHENDPLAWRAAWILDGSDEQYPGLAADFVASIVKALPGIKSKGTIRSLLRLLCRYDISEEELILVIMDQLGNNTVGFKSRGMRLIKKLEGEN